MARYIDADKMREDWLNNGENECIYDTNAVLDSIDSQPTADVVEVVRCEKCKHGEVSTMSKAKDGEEDIACYCNLKKKVTDIDWYCPNGERRDT